MDLDSFKLKILCRWHDMIKASQFTVFWQWKVGIEANGRAHILDEDHRDETCRRLLDILPGWQTYRPAPCDYRRVLPVSLKRIAVAYDQIRNYSLLELDRIPDEPLQLIWHELGRVKEQSGKKRKSGDYSIISVCKPLMFLWGQTLGLDSRNRRNIRHDNFPAITSRPPRSSRWRFVDWKRSLADLKEEVLRNAGIVEFCHDVSKSMYSSERNYPFGRFLDMYYIQCGKSYE